MDDSEVFRRTMEMSLENPTDRYKLISVAPFREILASNRTYSFGVTVGDNRKILQIDVENKTICLSMRGRIEHQFLFDDLVTFDQSDEAFGIKLVFTNKTFDVEVDTVEESHALSRLLCAVLERVDLRKMGVQQNETREKRVSQEDILNMAPAPVFIKEGILLKRGNTKFPVWSKRMMKVKQGEFSYFKPNEDQPLNIVQLWESNCEIKASESNGFSIYMNNRKYAFRVLSDKKKGEEERDEWVKALKRACRSKRTTMILLATKRASLKRKKGGKSPTNSRATVKTFMSTASDYTITEDNINAQRDGAENRNTIRKSSEKRLPSLRWGRKHLRQSKQGKKGIAEVVLPEPVLYSEIKNKTKQSGDSDKTAALKQVDEDKSSDDVDASIDETEMVRLAKLTRNDTLPCDTGEDNLFDSVDSTMDLAHQFDEVGESMYDQLPSTVRMVETEETDKEDHMKDSDRKSNASSESPPHMSDGESSSHSLDTSYDGLDEHDVYAELSCLDEESVDDELEKSLKSLDHLLESNLKDETDMLAHWMTSRLIGPKFQRLVSEESLLENEASIGEEDVKKAKVVGRSSDTPKVSSDTRPIPLPRSKKSFKVHFPKKGDNIFDQKRGAFVGETTRVTGGVSGNETTEMAQNEDASLKKDEEAMKEIEANKVVNDEAKNDDERIYENQVNTEAVYGNIPRKGDDDDKENIEHIGKQEEKARPVRPPPQPPVSKTPDLPLSDEGTPSTPPSPGDAPPTPPPPLVGVPLTSPPFILRPPPPPIIGLSMRVPPPPPAPPIGIPPGVPLTPPFSPGSPPPPPPMMGTKVASKFKKFHWNSTPDKLISGSIWDTKEKRAAFKLNEKLIGEQFGTVNQPSSATSQTDVSIKRKPTILLEGTRAQNVAIFLRGFSIHGEDLTDNLCKIREDDSEISISQLRAIKRFKPSIDDREMYKPFQQKQTTNNLHKVDLFMVELLEITELDLRVDLLLLLWEFPERLNCLIPAYDQLTECYEQFFKCHKFVSVLHYILDLGNYLNTGSLQQQHTRGFQLTSLSSLTEMKGNNRPYTLLYCLVQNLETNEPNLLTFSEELSKVAKCKEISIKALAAELDVLRIDLEKIKKSVRTLKKKLKKPTQAEKQFFDIIQVEVLEFEKQIVDAQKTNAHAYSLYQQTLARFGQDKQTSSPQFLEPIIDFIDKFDHLRRTLIG